MTETTWELLFKIIGMLCITVGFIATRYSKK